MCICPATLLSPNDSFPPLEVGGEQQRMVLARKFHRRVRKVNRWYWALILIAALLTGCATNPVTGKRELNIVSEQRELEIGKQQYLPSRQMQGGDNALNFGKTHPKVYNELTTDHPIDLVRYQVANCYMGRAGLINSGGASGDNDLHQAVSTAVINKRAGGMGMISGRKAFQKPMEEGITLLNAIQDVYLSSDITVA